MPYARPTRRIGKPTGKKGALKRKPRAIRKKGKLA